MFGKYYFLNAINMCEQQTGGMFKTIFARSENCFPKGFDHNSRCVES